MQSLTAGVEGEDHQMTKVDCLRRPQDCLAACVPGDCSEAAYSSDGHNTAFLNGDVLKELWMVEVELGPHAGPPLLVQEAEG